MVNTKALLHEDICLIMQPALIKCVGKSAALLLQQIHFWIKNKNTKGKFYKDRKWIANSYEEWVSDLKILSRSTINRSIKTLKDLGIISVEKLSDYKSNRTNWYTINYDRIEDFIGTNTGRKSGGIDHLNKDKSTKHLSSDQPNLSQSQSQNEPMVNDKKTNKEILINPIKSDKSSPIQNLSKIPLPQQMLDIWNEVIAPNTKSALTKERCKLLIAALKIKFKNDLLEWKNYCLKISSSDFLMGKIGKGFKILLDSALKFTFIQKIVENSYGVNDISTPPLADNNLHQILENPNDSIELQSLKRRIYERVGHDPYISWFKDCKMTVHENMLEIKAKSAFCRDRIKSHFARELKCIIDFSVEIC